ncbi:MAG: FkbM family methyltransferase, partial [Chloroflexota bacterium]
MTAVSACTIVARNYLPFARVLAHSYSEHHPDQLLSVLVIDGEPGESSSDEPFDILVPGDLALRRDEFLRMAACYDVMELATAIKPWLLECLLRKGADAVLYCDPDIEVFAPMVRFTDAALKHGIALTPHTTEPVPRDGRRPAESELMASGTFNLGMIALSQGALPFLSWWQERLRRDAIVDPERMLFTDQRWLDLALGYFSLYIFRDPGYNVAYWNASTRQLERVGDRYFANGSPLHTFHFSGFQPERPTQLSRHQGVQPRVLLSENPALREICRGYSERLLTAGYAVPLEPPFAFELIPDGPPLDRRMRRVYRRALLQHDHGEAPEPPNPFREGTPGEFLRWLQEPVARQYPLVGRYLLDLYSERTDLQVVFPQVPWKDNLSFLRWVETYGESDASVPEELIVRRPSPSWPRQTQGGTHKPGVNLAGLMDDAGGVGTVVRRLGQALHTAGISFSPIGYRPGQPLAPPAAGSAGAPTAYDLNLVCINASHIEDFAIRAGQEFFARRR